MIGGEGASNRIAFSQGLYTGVRIRAGSSNNAILCNQIFSNGALGIDLGVAGVLANDPCDSDSGANMQQNFPVLDTAWVTESTVTVSGTLDSSPSQSFRIQFLPTPRAMSPATVKDRFTWANWLSPPIIAAPGSKALFPRPSRKATSSPPPLRTPLAILLNLPKPFRCAPCPRWRSSILLASHFLSPGLATPVALS